MTSIKQYNLEGCSVGITDGSNLWSTPLRWPQMAWYTYQVSWRLIQAFKQYEGFASEIWEAVTLVLLMRGIYDVGRWNRLRWHDICTMFHDDRFRYLNNITVITATIWEAVMLVLLIEGIYEVRSSDGFMSHDIHTKFHEDWYKRSSNMKASPRKFEKL
jgi:hypothetical protein